MRATRKTQPYRRGTARHGGLALAMMRAGKAVGRPNPQDQGRLAAKLAAKRRRRGR